MNPEVRGSLNTSKGIKTGLILMSLMLLFSFVSPLAVAANPVISTTWTISNGAYSPPVYVDGVNFDPENDKFDFTVDMGTTGLEYDSVSFLDSSHMRFNFHGIAQAGTITIQANVSAYLPVETQASNTITLVVPVPFLPQSIYFTAPLAMKVKDPDQVLKATATSGLTVLLVSNKPSVCTIDFLKIHAVAGGTCSITATQGGNSVFAPAESVTQTFAILGLEPVFPTQPTKPAEAVTQLGSSVYDPNGANNIYVSVLVTASDLSEENAIPVKLLVPPGATNTPVVFLISSYSTDEESVNGYFVARIKAIAPDGTPSLHLKKPIEINIPAGASGSFPAWSYDGITWYKLKRLETEVLPADLHTGYFVEKDGRIAVFTDYLMLFGHRKDQAPLRIANTALSIPEGSRLILSTVGGSGTGALNFIERTPEICSVTSNGELETHNDGRCVIAARKASSGIFASAVSSSISIYVQPKNSVIAPSVGNLNNSSFCQEISHTVLKSSSLIYLNLCNQDAFETAYLEVGAKSNTGAWSYAVLGKQVLDRNGATIFNLSTPLKNGQKVRVKVRGKIEIELTIKAK